jgi:hypothetical protein
LDPTESLSDGNGKRSLPTVCIFAIGKASGLADATHPRGSRQPNLKDL